MWSLHPWGRQRSARLTNVVTLSRQWVVVPMTLISGEPFVD
jgi:hypothetical protein